MMIKQRIAISNILMLLIPTALILLLAALMYLSYINLYAASEQMLMEEYRKIYQAQEAVRNTSNAMEYATSSDALAQLQTSLTSELSQLGYSLKIWSQQEVLYTNFTDECQLLLDDFVPKSDSLPNYFFLDLGKASFIQSRIQLNNKAYFVTAINPASVPIHTDLDGHVRMLNHYVMILLIASLVIVLATNSIITARMAKNLIEPLELLSYGAGQIKDGNLDYVIHYDRWDEFGQVCADFNEMSLRLRESIQAQLNYEEDRKELIAGVSHDLRTPLTAIKGYIKGIQDGVANTPEKQARYLDITYTQACNMDLLVDKLFFYSRLEAGQFPFHFEPVDFSCYLEHFIAEAADKFMRAGLSISFDNQCEQAVIVCLDRSEMARVITNILENSIKYKAEELVHVHIKLFKKVFHNQKMVVLELNDNGPGVDHSQLSHLFKSFYRSDPSRTNTSQSSGLGLAIAARVITAHKGYIQAQNQNGLCIIIHLPVRTDQTNSLAAVEDKEKDKEGVSS